MRTSGGVHFLTFSAVINFLLEFIVWTLVKIICYWCIYATDIIYQLPTTLINTILRNNNNNNNTILGNGVSLFRKQRRNFHPNLMLTFLKSTLTVLHTCCVKRKSVFMNAIDKQGNRWCNGLYLSKMAAYGIKNWPGVKWVQKVDTQQHHCRPSNICDWFVETFSD